MASTSRVSEESEPDLVAFSSSSILPSSVHGGAGYSYGPPISGQPSADTSPELGRQQPVQQEGRQDDADGRGVGAFSNRSRARAASLATSQQSGLPMYSLRADDLATARRGSADEAREEGADVNDPDDLSEDEEDEEGSDLEMDTLNKNSQGRGGWKMLHLQDRDHPSSPVKLGNKIGAGGLRRSSSNTHLKGTHEKGSLEKQSKMTQYSRFERFDAAEWIAMSIAMVFVICLSIVALHICFWG
ncbi:MAG: hypothetical protein CYPHOPRED_001237 [Cyphobasidiales sp. Tagirdzhanova-0007]|nr:MAG: hypothetical protein CYPHOPRED_001237 [Cyphobasidiales sp. Tagirdzhanova-0007]